MTQCLRNWCFWLMLLPVDHIPQPPHTAGKRLSGPRAAIDLSQIPSVADTYLADQSIWTKEPFLTCQTERTIPLSASEYNAVDQGNSSPKFVRASTYAFPHSAHLASSCHIPLGFVFQPFAEQRSEENAIPLVSFDGNGPLRCLECRTYVNPWFRWTSGGQKWMCNICGTEAQVDPSYFSPLGSDGRRVDLSDRLELTSGTADFKVPEPYFSTPPPPRIFPTLPNMASPLVPVTSPRVPTAMRVLFVIECSPLAVASGLLSEICKSIEDVLYQNDQNVSGKSGLADCAVGFLTFNETLQFYDLSSCAPKELVVADLDDVFTPLHSGLFVNPFESRTAVSNLLTYLTRSPWSSHGDTNAVVLGPALKGALSVLLDIGGMVMLFHTSSSNASVGPSTPLSATRSDQDPSVFLSEPSFWRDVGEEFAGAGVGVHLFLFPASIINVAAIGSIAAITGGDIFYHPNFQLERDAAMLRSEIRRVASRETVYDVTLVARISSALRPSSYAGNFYETPTSEIKLGTLDSDKSIVVEMSHNNDLDINKDIYVQLAVLHTSRSGERRVRTVNLALGTSSLAANVFRYADIDACTIILYKQVLSRLASKSLDAVKEALTMDCATLLLAYRQHCAASTRPTQLIIPEAFKILPVYALGILKHPALRGGSVSPELRNYFRIKANSMTTPRSIWSLYPKMFALHDLDSFVGMPDPNTGWIPIPRYIPASHKFMESHGIYLIDNGELTVLWVGANTSPMHLRALFNADDVYDMPGTHNTPSSSSHLAQQLRNIVSVLERHRGGIVQPFLVARQNMDGSELQMGDMLVEDENNAAMSYIDYICHLHKIIYSAVSASNSFC
ncbi:uncharacterized protein EI90DRAFT_3281390 [Cantharellus anzutake]|uniref:uncharacterized protein n=1 Tax=Cantharellus anzutake TaxID=1750568 RepID=UPI0019085E89|nr:uncharacterized protein EI90DRAFT_3281390 [Cantharellus anzutake]KAF8328183.1 hypothetical protein EI90DRAFT_3281390 [Cantharellus anzutake]